MMPRSSGRDRYDGWGRWAFALLSLVAFLMALGASPASAHLRVTLAGPQDGERLDEPPTSVTVAFSEPVSPRDLTVEVRGEATGIDRELPPADPLARPEFTSVHEIRSGLPDDSYTITVMASGADGHVIRAQFAFVIGDGVLVRGGSPTSGAPRSSATLAVETVAAVLRNIGAAAAGAFFVALWCWPRLLPALRRPVLGGLALGAVSAVLGIVVFASAISGASLVGSLDHEVLTATLGGQHGRLQVLRLVSIVVLALIVVAFGSGRGARASLRPVALGSGIVLLLTLAATSHAGGQERTLLPLLLSMTHVGSTALWAGGLLTFWATTRRRPDRLAPDEGRRFSGVATPCVLLALASGAGLALDLTNGFDSSVVSPLLGVVLGAKLVLVVILLAVAAQTRAEVRRRDQAPEPGPGSARIDSSTTRVPVATQQAPVVQDEPVVWDVRRLVAVEARVGAMVFVLAALLTVVPS